MPEGLQPTLSRTSLDLMLVVLSILIASTGCVPNRAYRPGEAATQAPPQPLATDSTQIHSGNFKLGFVEFDDMGELWEPCASLHLGTECQLSRVLALIRNEKKASCTTDNCERDIVVVVFVHGWKNNASAYNEEHKNLYAFKNLLAQLSNKEALLARGSGRPARSYIGVYIAWRGQVLAGDLFATFWNRRNAAARIAGPAFSEAIYRIISVSKEGTPNAKVVVVGHSFGARILENAISDAFVSLVLPKPAAEPATESNPIAPADLIVYVNSANDSFHAKAMIELLKRTSIGVARTPGLPAGPLFLSVTSEGDMATKVAFPIGQELSALTKAFRKTEPSTVGSRSPGQRAYFTRTPGHISPLWSHEVVKGSTESITCKSDGDVVRFYTGDSCYSLEPRPSRWNDSPYWVTEVPKAIIPDHSQVFTDAFVEMLMQVIVHYEVIDSPQPTRMLLR